jgi:pSer/pThr/pTyr-binding forkhead associated (FHA) protein
MDVRLVVTQGKQSGQEIPITGRKFFIGRAEDCHLRPHSDLISRHHCVILVEEGVITIRDFGSKNGTYVNGERVNAEVELKAGDHLKVGGLEFDVKVEVTVGGKKLPKVHSVQEAAVRTVEKQKPPVEKVAAARDDADMSDWLSEEDSSSLGDTAALESPTQTIAKKDKEEKEEVQAAVPAPAEEEPVAEDPAANERLDQAKADAANSQNAAAQGLKNLFRRF